MLIYFEVCNAGPYSKIECIKSSYDIGRTYTRAFGF